MIDRLLQLACSVGAEGSNANMAADSIIRRAAIFWILSAAAVVASAVPLPKNRRIPDE
jgi:hypothetical protein